MRSNRLDNIYEMLVDSQRGYAEAAEIAESPDISRMFADRARERQSLVQRFNGIVSGADVDRGEGSVAGTAHRLFVNLRRMVQDDTKVALAEVERGESAFVEVIARALNENDLVGTDRQLVSDLYQQVMSDRDAFAGMSARY